MTDPIRPPPDAPQDEFQALLRTTAWHATPLGPLAQWPKSLRGFAEMVLALPTPAILFWGPEQTQIYNAGYAAILGPRHPQAFAQAYREAWPDTYPVIYPWMRHVLDAGGTWRVEREHIPLTRHGFDEEAFFTFTFSALRDDDGRIAGILQPVFEVTESVLADRRAETLRAVVPEPTAASVSASASAIEHAMAAMAGNPGDLPFASAWLWDPQAMELARAGSMGAALAAADVASLAVVARNVWSENTPRFVDALDAVAGGVARGVLLLPLEGGTGQAPAGVIAFGVSRRLHFDGRYRKFLELVARQVASGLQRAQASLEAERQHRYLAELFARAPAGIAVITGPQHVFEMANPTYVQFMGRRELVGMPLLEALPELKHQVIPVMLDRVYRSGEAEIGSEMLARISRGADGAIEDVFFNFIYQPLRDDRGLTRGIMMFAYEVTEQVNARLRAEHLADELRAEHRRKDDFLAMLAHELRNPLAPIAAAAEVLRLGHADDPRLRRTSEIVTRQVRHMSTLIDDLLDASRVTRGIVTIERHAQDLRDIVAAAVEQVTPMMDSRHQHLQVQVGDAPVPVSGDGKRLVQTLANLLDNAAKYTPERGSIAVALSHDQDWATLSVRDNGVGVPSELRERIFDLFVQGTRAVDRAQGGLGIGLALARRLVDLHGGTLTCESAGVDQGSEFRIRLPLAPAAPATDCAGVEPVAHAPVTASPRLRILVVDDNEDAASMLAMLLAHAGHAVTTESDPFVALERARATRPDVCVLDIGLPRMDGHELARRLRATPEGRDATLIALTGYGHAADRDKAAQAGFDHYLVKPPDSEALDAVLASVAAQGRSNKAS
jgi:signal transduction histidine kinase/ActR/RegA family two-component response regulator